MNWQIVKNLSFIAIGILAIVGIAYAGEGGDIASLAGKVKTQATAVATLLNVAAYVAGVGFALAGILQFKAHKENPQQTPLSKPVVMIVVAACLLFLPTIMEVAGSSLFESGKKAIEYEAPSGK